MSREAWIVVGVLAAIVAVVTVYGAIRLAGRLLTTKRMLGDLGVGGKVAFYGALIYTILPIDLLPDPIYLDDMGVLAVALLYLTNLLRKRRARGPVVPPRRDPGTKITGSRRP
jgi:hypothetical protein